MALKQIGLFGLGWLLCITAQNLQEVVVTALQDVCLQGSACSKKKTEPSAFVQTRTAAGKTNKMESGDELLQQDPRDEQKYETLGPDGTVKTKEGRAFEEGSDDLAEYQKIDIALVAQSEKKNEACQPAQESQRDAGYADQYRGWYDVQGCGQCNDYCRWVGWSGSGGPPEKKLIKGGSFWSCRLAGSSETYTPKNWFKSWSLTKCKYQGEKICLPAQESQRDSGYVDQYRGWYDVQGCGQCNDYCRWVGWSRSGGSPEKKLIKGGSWWSCRLAGSRETYTPKNWFKSWSLTKCKYQGEKLGDKLCLPAQESQRDAGYVDQYRGWYDVQGCGQCNDYCRWVGWSRSGGPPDKKLIKGRSWWSCRLAGSREAYTPKYWFKSWSLTKCKYQGEKLCLPAQESQRDAGYVDQYRGWYDVQGCGRCNDYCRWVGWSGSGGPPEKKLIKGGSFWSCRLAGSRETYTPKYWFKSWSLTKCNGPGEKTP